jgi:RNA polymerase sigma-70 factor (ECF subfamily)
MAMSAFPETIADSSRMHHAGVARMMHIAGDDRTEAFNRLYRDNADKVYALCLRMSHDSSRATEIAQDVFIRVWRNMSMLREGSDSGAWVWRVAVNVALNGLRSDRRLRAREELVGDIGPHERPPEVSTPIPLKRIALLAAIRTLPPRARKVFILHDVEGHSHNEVARLLDIAPGTVRAQLHRARALMRERLR